MKPNYIVVTWTELCGPCKPCTCNYYIKLVAYQTSYMYMYSLLIELTGLNQLSRDRWLVWPIMAQKDEAKQHKPNPKAVIFKNCLRGDVNPRPAFMLSALPLS